MRIITLALLVSVTVTFAFREEDYLIQVAEEQLNAELDAEAGVIFSLMGDDNDITFYQVGGEIYFYLTPSLPIRGQYLTGEIEQDKEPASSIPDTKFDRDALTLRVDEYQLTPQWLLSGRYTYEEFDIGELHGGEVGVGFKDEGNSKYQIRASRETFWTKHDSRAPRQYPRLVDLSIIPQDFRIDTIKGIIDWVPTYEQEFHAEASFSDFEDNNELFTVYLHYQIPLPGNTPDRWIVIRPNIYYESFSDEAEAYYSPEHHFTVGLGGHLVRKYEGGAKLEIEVIPIWLFRQEDIPSTDDDYEVGIQGIADLTVPIGRFDAGVGVFGYYETDEYWLWRVAGRIVYNF